MTILKFLKLLLLSLLILAISGCSNNAPTESINEQTTVKVMYYDEQQFFRDYGELLYAKFPNIEIEVVTMQSMYNSINNEELDPEKALKDFIDQEKPDIIYTQGAQYEGLIHEGRLLKLDTLIEADKYDMSTFIPSITDYLRDMGDGSLYGLAPRFNSTALYYNIDLFEQHGIELPTDSMDWSQLFQLAQRFPNGDEDNLLYGFSVQEYSRLSDVLRMVIETEGLSLFDSVSKKITFDTESYRKAFRSVVEMYQSGAINTPRDFNPGGMVPMVMEQNYLLQNPFIAGKSAMIIDSPDIMRQIEQAEQQINEYDAFDYGIVTVPTSTTDPEAGGQLNIWQIYAVNSISENSDAAWELVKYINSDDMARIKSKSSTYDLSTRSSFNSERNGHSMEPFYALKPGGSNMYSDLFSDMFSNVPTNLLNDFYQTFDKLLNDQLKKAIENVVTVDDAVKTIQEQGQQALDRTLLSEQSE